MRAAELFVSWTLYQRREVDAIASVVREWSCQVGPIDSAFPSLTYFKCRFAAPELDRSMGVGASLAPIALAHATAWRALAYDIGLHLVASSTELASMPPKPQDAVVDSILLDAGCPYKPEVTASARVDWSRDLAPLAKHSVDAFDAMRSAGDVLRFIDPASEPTTRPKSKQPISSA